jgi:hypothetical protein
VATVTPAQIPDDIVEEHEHRKRIFCTLAGIAPRDRDERCGSGLELDLDVIDVD